jgi:hypothetical protein
MWIDYSVIQKEKQQPKLKMENGQKSNKGTGRYCNLHPYLQHKPSRLFNHGQSDGKAYTAHA